MDKDELQLALWKFFLSRCKWERVKAEAEAKGDAAGVEAADQALAELPEVSPMDGLRANAELVSRLTVQRWIGMKVARDKGASLEQIGRELGVSRQSAWEFMQRRIAEHGGEMPLDEAAGPPPLDDDRWRLLQGKMDEHRRQMPSRDPVWEEFIAHHKVGDVLEGVVTGVVPFGAFVEVAEGIGGLLPKSVSPAPPEPGSRISVRITGIDVQNRRMSLEPGTGTS